MNSSQAGPSGPSHQDPTSSYSSYLEFPLHVKSGACSYCRQRKVRCSGDRPRCTACLRHGRDCTYMPHNTRKRIPKADVHKPKAKGTAADGLAASETPIATDGSDIHPSLPEYGLPVSQPMLPAQYSESLQHDPLTHNFNVAAQFSNASHHDEMFGRASGIDLSFLNNLDFFGTLDRNDHTRADAAMHSKKINIRLPYFR
jgi:hypothetical protein